MDVPLDTPREIVVRVAGDDEPSAPTSPVSAALDVAVRGLLTGIGAGLIVFAGDRAGITSATVLGVLTLGATLVQWDR
jgi:hypothetical protein